MRTSSSSGDQVSAGALRRLLRPFSPHSSTIARYPGGARKCNARASPGSADSPRSFNASSMISSASGMLRLPTSTLLCAAFADFIDFFSVCRASRLRAKDSSCSSKSAPLPWMHFDPLRRWSGRLSTGSAGSCLYSASGCGAGGISRINVRQSKVWKRLNPNESHLRLLPHMNSRKTLANPSVQSYTQPSVPYHAVFWQSLAEHVCVPSHGQPRMAGKGARPWLPASQGGRQGIQNHHLRVLAGTVHAGGLIDFAPRENRPDRGCRGFPAAVWGRNGRFRGRFGRLRGGMQV